MTDIKAFLKENAIKKDTIEYVASNSFVANGEPVAWRLKVLSNDQLDAIKHRCTRREFNKATKEFGTHTDLDRFNNELVVASVEYPDLNLTELQESYGVVGAADLVKAMLNAGEYADLVNAVVEAQGFETGMGDKIKHVKNS